MQTPFDCLSENGLRTQADALKTYGVCIAPELKYVSDDRLNILREYVRGGGRLLLIGDFATHDEMCRPRSRPDWLPQSNGEQRLEKGMVVHRSLMPTRGEMLELLAPAGELRLVTAQGNGRPMLRVMMYESPQERIVHLLNYSCPVEPGAEPIPEKEVQVRVPLPEGKSPASVTCLSPEAGESSPKFELRDGACWFTVPEVPIYVVCRLRLK
jgi:hypothetical protein